MDTFPRTIWERDFIVLLFVGLFMAIVIVGVMGSTYELVKFVKKVQLF